jgi:hypothetical protein
MDGEDGCGCGCGCGCGSGEAVAVAVAVAVAEGVIIESTDCRNFGGELEIMQWRLMDRTKKY